jgi:hypothetical protein
VTANEVLVPTLVEKPGGGVVYGLKPQDFVLEDNGVPQKIRVQEEMDTAPVALVVAVELGGVGVLEFDKLAKLGPLLDLFLSDGKGQAALVGFDSKPHLIRDFTHSRYPHPYFGRKILVFLRLQTGLRCKIVKTKEFPAKSSRIRSYGPFRPLLAFPAERRREEDVPGR